MTQNLLPASPLLTQICHNILRARDWQLVTRRGAEEEEQRRGRGGREEESREWISGSLLLSWLGLFPHRYDWQSQRRFKRACPHTRSAVTVTERSVAWRVQKEPRVAVPHTRGRGRRVSDYSECYLLLLFTRRGQINKVCNAAGYVRVSQALTSVDIWVKSGFEVSRFSTGQLYYS